ncbi:MAG TPA: cupredoxin domain-containing protein [Vicinamibacterales bacterium]
MSRTELVLIVLLLLAGLPEAARAPQPAVREFTVAAKKYAFEPAQFEVTEGDEVRFVVTSTDADHGFEIKRLDIEELVPEGRTKTIAFTAPAAGKYAIRCSEWCGKGHKTMKATLVVHPRSGS